MPTSCDDVLLRAPTEKPLRSLTFFYRRQCTPMASFNMHMEQAGRHHGHVLVRAELVHGEAHGVLLDREAQMILIKKKLICKVRH
jgi:hypothetical protein